MTSKQVLSKTLDDFLVDREARDFFVTLLKLACRGRPNYDFLAAGLDKLVDKPKALHRLAGVIFEPDARGRK